ncbi:MAG TPA: hypothetical protein VK638_27060 [Edaphobacter sp.]|nr:hypothetical protein [Edaphobacter sp.]
MSFRYCLTQIERALIAALQSSIITCAGMAQSKQAECVWVDPGLTPRTAVNQEPVVLGAREEQRNAPLPPEIGLVRPKAMRAELEANGLGATSRVAERYEP